MTSDQQKNSKGKRQFLGRYQNLMLVGERGQVIPFQRFKNLAKLLIAGLVISVILVVVLGALLAGSQHRYNQLKSDLDETRQMLTKLRDEKDLLLTQIVIKKKQRSGAPPSVDQNKPSDAAPSEAVPVAQKKPEKALVAPPPKEKAAPKEPPKNATAKLSADARRIKVSYQAERSLLTLSFRIYNTSKPKVPLAGRTVTVFKNQDDPPIKWLVVPRVPLVDGKPGGEKGKAFKINNYRTEKFRAYGQKAPVRFNTATVYIFSSDGELLFSKDHSFKIEAKPIPKPVIPAPKPKQETPKPPVAPIVPVNPPTAPKPEMPSANTDTTTVTDSDATTTVSPPPPSLPAVQGETGADAPPATGPALPPDTPVQPDVPATPDIPPNPSESDASPAPGEPPTKPTTQGEQQ